MPKRTRETASVEYSSAECRVATSRTDAGNEIKTLQIRFAFFNAPYEVGDIPDRPGTGMFLEDFDRRAFEKTIQEQNIRVLFNHDSNQVLGSTKPANGKPPTARVWTDDRGAVCELLDIGTRSYELDMLQSIERGEVSGASHAFYVIRRDLLDPAEEGGLPMRFIREAQLDEVSICTFPQNRDTSISRSSDEARLKDFELYTQSKRDQETTETPDANHSEEHPEPEAHNLSAEPSDVEILRARLRLLKLKVRQVENENPRIVRKA